MSHQPGTNSTHLARRHALKLIGSAGARLAATTGLVAAMVPGRASARPGNGRGWAWGWGKGGESASCLLAGTMILTATGEMPVETLKIGDLVLTKDRGPVAVKWVGRQSFVRSPGRPWIITVTPVLIRAHAIALNVPRRDLLVSRSHSVWIDGHLVPSDLLINGRSIVSAPVDGLDRLDYVHLELDGHEVVFAEGLGVETFFGRSREQFSNFAEYLRLYGADEPVTPRHPAAYGSWPALRGLALTLAAPLLGTEDPIRRAHRRITERWAVVGERD